ncbi:unnamed protein product [Caretta caretta]
MLSTEPTVVQDDLVSWKGDLLAQDSTMGTDRSWKQAPSEDSEETLLLKLIPEEALQQKELSSKELSDAPSGDKPTTEHVANMEGTEVAP